MLKKSYYYFRIVDPEMALNMLHKQTPKPMAVGVSQQPSMPPNLPDRFRVSGGDHSGSSHFAPHQADMDRRDPRMDDR